MDFVMGTKQYHYTQVFLKIGSTESPALDNFLTNRHCTYSCG